MSIITLSPIVIQAFDEAKDAFGTLSDLKSAVNNVEAGQHPDLHEHGDWSSIVTKYNNAAATINGAPVVDNFDSGPYTISADELANCANLNNNVAKLNAYKQALIDAVDGGNNGLEVIQGQIDIINQTRDALTYLIGVFADAATNPLLTPYNDIFVLDWDELQSDVNHALETYASAVNSQKAQLTTVIANINTQIGNLAANINTIIGLCGG
ncbi:hypothetical protein ACFS5N_04575 [Mucilaginibacter ximonensis]|uniref:Uncharacterized protein n=1 Tax=Mucilaginibacter ximonensis TaxID=538021 RepID=A0ABW5Y9M5_9SPHI